MWPVYRTLPRSRWPCRSHLPALPGEGLHRFMDEPNCLTISANLFFRFGQLELHQLLEKISYASLSF
jgi:hypothetical protein